MTDLAAQITAMATPLAASLGVDLWGVELQAGSRTVLRVYVEKEGGVAIDECAELSRMLGLALEVEDILENAYVLEVSSPGLERIFFTQEQLAAALGKKLELALFKPVPEYPGRKKFAGILRAVKDGIVTLELDDASVTGAGNNLLPIAYSDIKKARQLYVAPDKTPPGKKGHKKNTKNKHGDATSSTPSDVKEGMLADDLA